MGGIITTLEVPLNAPDFASLRFPAESVACPQKYLREAIHGLTSHKVAG
jgi:hypothetical protein